MARGWRNLARCICYDFPARRDEESADVLTKPRLGAGGKRLVSMVHVVALLVALRPQATQRLASLA